MQLEKMRVKYLEAVKIALIESINRGDEFQAGGVSMNDFVGIFNEIGGLVDEDDLDINGWQADYALTGTYKSRLYALDGRGYYGTIHLYECD